MAKIKIMSENLANKIAAGEVVEKCASVVKELVENSIDAGSKNISIDLQNGGLKEIKITDDGCGMEHDDALLSFQRHATSKLLRDDDLFFINTLGFRGEALPSIASVSEVDLITCASSIGTHIKIKGGKLEIDENSDARRGTIFTVSNLFYNTPARLKYLKSEQYELANTTSFIERLALSYPDIKFTLTNNDRTILKTSGSNNLLKTIHEIYGLNVSSKMMEINASNDDYEISGYICKPEILKSNKNHMITIVNGRIVKNYELTKAINDAYFRYKPDIKYPLVVIKIDTDPTLIDVNIHPTKQDIKFSKTAQLYDLIITTIKEKLSEELLIPNALKSEAVITQAQETEVKNIVNRLVASTINASNEEKKVEEKEDIQTQMNFMIQEESEEYLPRVEKNIVEDEQKEDKVINKDMQNLDLYVVGQILGTYIVAQNEEGLFLIDQHAAQERVNYEKFLKIFKEDTEIRTIEPMIPLTFELSTSDFLKIKRHMNILNDLGFLLEDFGINTYKVLKHPTWLKENKEAETINNLFEAIIDLGNNFDRVKFNNSIAASMACKSSIRANTKISNEAAESIIKQLVKCNNPYNCAHGRPTIVKFSTYDLERMFKRVMN